MSSSADRHMSDSGVDVGNVPLLPKGTYVDFWVEGSIRTLHPKKHYFVAIKVDKKNKTLSYGATIYAQAKNEDGTLDTLDENAHFRTALHRLEVLPITIENPPESCLVDDSDMWLDEVRDFIGSLFFSVGCFDAPPKNGPSTLATPVIVAHQTRRYLYDYRTGNVETIEAVTESSPSTKPSLNRAPVTYDEYDSLRRQVSVLRMRLYDVSQRLESRVSADEPAAGDTATIPSGCESVENIQVHDDNDNNIEHEHEPVNKTDIADVSGESDASHSSDSD